MPVNIYELGLIYDIKVNELNEVEILMTLTAPNCPEAGGILEQVNRDVGNLHDVTNVSIDLTFDPAWDREMLSDAAKLELGLL